ncbi:MAG TPA: hypothetical protein VF422_06320 [Dokdonella sp.]
MDPISIDLKSVAGIVALTIGLVQYIKGWLGTKPVLKAIPIAAYVVFVSVALTLGVHQYTPWLPGDEKDLVWQAILQALMASGAFEWIRAGGKPAAATNAARSLNSGGFPVILLAVLLGIGAVGCAKVTPAMKAGEKNVRTTVLFVANQVEPMVCNAEARKVLTAKPCLELLDALEPAVDLAIAYNRAIAQGTLPPIAETVASIEQLIAAVKQVIPDGPAKASALLDLSRARALAEGGK